MTAKGRLVNRPSLSGSRSENQEALARALTCRVRREILRAAARQCRVPLPATRAMVGMALCKAAWASSSILLGHCLAHLAHHVFDPGLTALVAQPPFFVLSGPFQGG